MQDPSEFDVALRVRALESLLVEKGLVQPKALAAIVETYETKITPANGARVVARAWRDSEFKARLLDDANSALTEFGLDLTHWSPVKLRAVENTPQVHNVIVCTLCSCYPIALLGPSPAWYKSEGYRSRVVREPRAVLREFGCVIPADVRINVWDSTAELRYFVIPQCPVDARRCSEDELALLVSRDALIGVAPAGPVG